MIDTGLSTENFGTLNSVFKKYPQISQVILFGSRAKGTAGNNSDIDLAIVGIDDELQIQAIAMELEELPLPYQFDVKAFSSITNPKLKEHIQRVGMLIFPCNKRTTNMTECKNEENKHHHRGKSSESLLDKSRILANLSIKPGLVVLDAGCGNGYMTKEFAKLAGKTGMVYALDPDTVSIDILKAETSGMNVEAFAGDITQETKLAESSIDLIYLSTVIHGFSKIQMKGFLKEIKRLLKPGGKLAIVEIKKENTPFGPPLDIRLSPEELKKIIDLTPAQLVDVGEYFYMQVFNK
jgi:2-polyprenyl-3-methyl-5-hydroxy-6-metoxy-1,4-benzoquinol methylase